MKKIIRSIAAISFAMALVLLGTTSFMNVNAQTTNTASGNGIKVSPVRTDLTITAGQSKTVTMNVQNITNSPAEFQAIINDFVPSGEAGQPALILDANKFAPSHSLKRYIQPITNVPLKAGENKDVKVTIVIPKDAAGGGYYGAVRFAPAGEQGGKNVTLSASVGSIILVKVPGDIKNDMKIDSLDVRKGVDGVGGSAFFTTNKDLYSVVRFKNTGNVHEQPFGKIRLKQGDKVLQEIEINNTEPRGNVLPDSVRRFNNELTKVPAFGKFTVEGNFGYGDNSQLVSGRTTFWVIPLALIVGVVVAIIVLLSLIFGLPRAIKRYNQNVIRKASRR